MNNRACFRLGLVIALVACTVLALAQQPTLTFSGVLGQSQPAASTPASFVDCSGLAMDNSGALWVVATESIYKFQQQQQHWVITNSLKLPTWMEVLNQLGARWDGAKLYLGAGDRRLYVVSLAAKTVQPVMSFPTTVKTYAITPVGMTSGYAAKGKIFTLDGDTVSAFAADGTPRGTVLTITRQAGEQWEARTLGLDPASGDLLIGGHWPDAKVHRFDSAGHEVLTADWPRPVFAGLLQTVGKHCWAMNYGGGALELSPTVATARSIKERWNMYTASLVEDPRGGYWLGTSEGVIHYDRDGNPTLRLGAIPASCLAAATDGTLLAVAGDRVTRLSIADHPTTPFQSNANEPWRIGGNWNGRIAAIGWDGQYFLVLDGAKRQLWQFDPWHTGWMEKTWEKVTEAGAFTQPRALACGDTLTWILDGKTLLEGPRVALNARKAITLPDQPDISSAVALAALDDEILYVAWHNKVCAYSRTAQGGYQARWECNTFTKITSLAVTKNTLLVGDADTHAITLLAADTGMVQSICHAEQIQHGMQPISITTNQRWVLVLDGTGNRILRFKLTTL